MKRSTQDLVRVHILLDREDNERLKATFGEHPGYSAAIRLIIKKFLKQLENRVDAQGVEITEIENV